MVSDPVLPGCVRPLHDQATAAQPRDFPAPTLDTKEYHCHWFVLSKGLHARGGAARP